MLKLRNPFFAFVALLACPTIIAWCVVMTVSISFHFPADIHVNLHDAFIAALKAASENFLPVLQKSFELPTV